MKILLTAINAKYIHSNLAVYSLKAYASAYAKQTEIAEYTINHQNDDILAGLYRRRPDVIAFSCYIWNIEVVKSLTRELAKLLPHVPIWVGGPEVSYDAVPFLEENPQIFGVMKGEGKRPSTPWYSTIQREKESLGVCPGLLSDRRRVESGIMDGRLFWIWMRSPLFMRGWRRLPTGSFTTKAAGAAPSPAATACPPWRNRCASGVWSL